VLRCTGVLSTALPGAMSFSSVLIATCQTVFDGAFLLCSVVEIMLCWPSLLLQRMRARLMTHFQRAFERCDVILTPATPTTAPVLPAEANTTGVLGRAG